MKRVITDLIYNNLFPVFMDDEVDLYFVFYEIVG